MDPKKRLSLDELRSHPWLLTAAAQNETPLQTPTTLKPQTGLLQFVFYFIFGILQ